MAGCLTPANGADTLRLMSLMRIRRWSRLIATILVVAAFPAMPHFAQDDLACDLAATASAQHDASQHGFRAAGDTGERDHCALCHWARSLRSPLTPLGVTASPAAAAAIEHALVAAVPVAPALATLPARAPPAGLL
jgi:hypothetical protein